MDSKRFITSLLIATAIMFGVMWFMRPGGFGGGGSSSGTTRSILYPDPSSPIEPKVNPNGPQPQVITLGGAGKDDNATLALRINNVTAGIDSVQLNVKQYAADIKGTEPLTLFQFDPTRQPARPFATLGIHITRDGEAKELPYGFLHTKKDNGTIDLRRVTSDDSAKDIESANATNFLDSANIWNVDSIEKTDGVPTDATLSTNINVTVNGNKVPLLKIAKRFHLDPKTYDLTITHSVENLSNLKLKVAIDQTTAPNLKRDDPQADDRFFHGIALNSAKRFVNADSAYNLLWGELRKRTAATGSDPVGGPNGQFHDFAKDPQLWVASSNRFFAAIVRPLPESGNTGTFQLKTDHLIPTPSHVAAAYVDLMNAGKDSADDAAIVRLTGRALDIAPKAKVDLPLAVFIGPKQREILQGNLSAGTDTPEHRNQTDHALFQYSKLLQFNTCFLYSPCFIEQIAHYILQALDFLKKTIAFGNYGVAIMILVVIVRALLHPLTRMSQVNMAKMSKQMRDVAPKIEAMKKKYADNKKKQNEEMMRIYRENNINPAGGIMGCIPMLIQMPIWVALYAGLRADIDLRHMPFIPGWINDLASPDTVWPHVIPAFGHPLFSIPLVGEIYGLNLLPILLTGVFYFQMKVTTASQPKPADEQQAQMQKMSQYMIFIFPLFLYNAPSGLNLYIFASTMGGLLDTYIVRKSLKKQGLLAPTAPLLPTHEGDDKKS